MIDHARVRTIVERFLAAPGEMVTNVVDDDGAVIVETSVWAWIVRPATPLRWSSESAWERYEAWPDIDSDPGPQPEGFAVDDRRTVLYLRDAGDFRRYWRDVRQWLDASALADLLERYQSQSPPSHILADPATLGRYVGGAAVAGIQGVDGPRSDFGADGTLAAVTFFTWRIGGSDGVTVDRWDVVVDGDELLWSVTEAARDLRLWPAK